MSDPFGFGFRCILVAVTRSHKSGTRYGLILYLESSTHKILPAKFTRCAPTPKEDMERRSWMPTFIVSTVIFQSGLHCVGGQTGRPPVTRLYLVTVTKTSNPPLCTPISWFVTGKKREAKQLLDTARTMCFYCHGVGLWLLPSPQ